MDALFRLLHSLPTTSLLCFLPFTSAPWQKPFIRIRKYIVCVVLHSLCIPVANIPEKSGPSVLAILGEASVFVQTLLIYCS